MGNKGAKFSAPVTPPLDQSGVTQGDNSSSSDDNYGWDLAIAKVMGNNCAKFSAHHAGMESNKPDEKDSQDDNYGWGKAFAKVMKTK